MKHINFIKPISASQASSITVWLCSSLALTISMIIYLGIISWHEYWNLQTLKNTQQRLHLNVASFDTVMRRKQELKKQEQMIKDQLHLIATASKQTQRHALYLAHIKKTLKSWAALESLNLESTGIQICIDCAQTQQAHEIISSLAQLPDVTELHMSSLQPKQQGNITALRLNLRGTIKQSS